MAKIYKTFQVLQAPAKERMRVWVRSTQGDFYHRYLIRRFRTGAHYWSNLLRVEAAAEFCLSCLSQALAVNYQRRTCHSCGARYEIVDAEP